MRRNTIDIPKETLEHLYWDERLTMKAIAEKLGLSVTPVYRSMERHNIKRRPIIEYQQIARGKLGISGSQLRELYIDHQLPIVYIASQLGLGERTIRKLLNDYGISIRSMQEANKISAPKRLRDKDGHGRNWQGGITHNSHGYILKQSPGHPRANAKGYVYEHILVWEATHGKPLPKGWITHHLNGVRDDNRPENLMGMSRKAHGDVSKPFKKRILELENQIRELQQLKLIKKVELCQ